MKSVSESFSFELNQLIGMGLSREHGREEILTQFWTYAPSQRGSYLTDSLN